MRLCQICTKILFIYFFHSIFQLFQSSPFSLIIPRSHAAILEYLIESGQFPDTVAAMQRESGISGVAASGDASGASKGILEKKWTSVVRLQRKVITNYQCMLLPQMI